jgi:HEAT repeat protein
VDAWRGKLKWDAQLSALTAAALNSKDDAARDSAVEVQLAAYGLIKSGSTVDALERQANSSDHSRKVWALWALGLMGNRGIQTERVVDILTAHLKEIDGKSVGLSEDARRWVVESLAMVGTAATITALLDAMHNDPSPMVRESAAANLAESSMLSRNQRILAVPQLINFSDDPSLDAQTHLWAFQALGEITRERVPSTSAAWRDWYRHNNSEN